MYIGLFHIPMFLNCQPLSTAMKKVAFFFHHHSPWFSLMEIEEYTRVSQSQFATKGWVKTYEISHMSYGQYWVLLTIHRGWSSNG